MPPDGPNGKLQETRPYQVTRDQSKDEVKVSLPIAIVRSNELPAAVLSWDFPVGKDAEGKPILAGDAEDEKIVEWVKANIMDGPLKSSTSHLVQDTFGTMMIQNKLEGKGK